MLKRYLLTNILDFSIVMVWNLRMCRAHLSDIVHTEVDGAGVEVGEDVVNAARVRQLETLHLPIREEYCVT